MSKKYLPLSNVREDRSTSSFNSHCLQLCMQLNKWAKNRETATESASVEAAVNTQPTGDAVNTQPTATEPKKPLTLEEKIDQNVTFNGCCAFCSLLCICTIPMLIVVFTAFLVTSVVSWHLSTVQLVVWAYYVYVLCKPSYS